MVNLLNLVNYMLKLIYFHLSLNVKGMSPNVLSPTGAKSLNEKFDSLPLTQRTRVYSELASTKSTSSTSGSGSYFEARTCFFYKIFPRAVEQ